MTEKTARALTALFHLALRLVPTHTVCFAWDGDAGTVSLSFGEECFRGLEATESTLTMLRLRLARWAGVREDGPETIGRL